MLPRCRKRPVGLGERWRWFIFRLVRFHVPRLVLFHFPRLFVYLLGLFTLSIIVVFFILTCRPSWVSCTDKVQGTKYSVEHIANGAYPMWATDNVEACPASLADLAQYRNSKRTKDSWGNELIMVCGASAQQAATLFVVVSKGPDGLLGTDDDIGASTKVVP